MARTFKAMAFGHLATLHEGAPIEAGIDNPDASFVSRAEVFAEAISLLEQARDGTIATPLSDEFRDDIQADGFDLEVTIYALLARYNLMAGNLAAAEQAADLVPPAARSEFRFSANDQNPVYSTTYNSGNAFQLRARQDFRLEAESGDARVEYWVSPASIAGANRTLDDLARYRDPTDAFAIYLPDEMKLIRAEVAARSDDLATAIDLINEVRTQCNATGEPAACLDALDSGDLPSEQAVLDEILEQRRKYDFLPLPQTECDRNASAPC
jgi:hypothetical protein